MKKFIVGAALAAAAVTPLGAQESVVSGKPSVFSITPYVGYAKYGDHFEFTPPAGTQVEFTNDDAAVFGVQAGFDFTRNFSLLGNFAYSNTHWEFETDGPGTNDDEQDAGDVALWFYDANLQFKLPMFMGKTAFVPFAQAGLGAIKFTADENDFGSKGQANMAYNVGLGADWQISGVGLRLMAKDYISSFEWDDISSLDEGNTFNATTSHNWVFSLGLKLGF